MGTRLAGQSRCGDPNKVGEARTLRAREIARAADSYWRYPSSRFAARTNSVVKAAGKYEIRFTSSPVILSSRAHLACDSSRLVLRFRDEVSRESRRHHNRSPARIAVK